MSLGHIAYADWQAIQPDMDKLKNDTAKCNTTLYQELEKCKSCAKKECEPSLEEIIVYYLEEGAQPFVEFGNMVADWGAWQEIGDFFEDKGEAFANWGGWGTMEDFFSNVGKGFVGWSGWEEFEDLGKTIGSGLVNFGKKFGDIGKIGDLFRRRRSSKELAYLYRALAELYTREEELDPKVKQCMEKCDVCAPFLLDKNGMIDSVCGPELRQLNTSVFFRVTRVQLAKTFFEDKGNPIIIKFEYTPAFDPTIMGFKPVRLTAVVNQGANPSNTYVSKNPYKLGQIPATAALMAKEYFEEKLNQWATMCLRACVRVRVCFVCVHACVSHKVSNNI